MKKPSPPPMPLPKFSIRTKRKGKKPAPLVCPMPPRPKALSEEQLSAFKDQILIVLADYRDSVNPKALEGLDPITSNPLSNEGTRIEIANRIINNLRIIAKVPKP